MKKILTLAILLAVSAGTTFAANEYSLKQAIKTDINNQKSAIKTDMDNAKKKRESAAAVKKEEKIKQIDLKLAELNKQMKQVKNQTTGITESERALRMNVLQRQIDFYNKQKAALK